MGRSRKRRPSARSKHEAVRKLMDYDALFLEQGGKCGICGRDWVEGKRFDRDHDRLTMTPRGLLCRRCNRLLTRYLTIEWLEQALTYLRKYV